MLSVYLSSVVSLGIKSPALMITDIKKIFFLHQETFNPESKKNADYIARRWSQNSLPYSNLLAARCFVLQWNFSFGAPLFREHKIWSGKNFYISFVFVTSTKATPQFRGKRHLFWVPKTGFNIHSGDTSAVKKWLTTKIVDKLKYLTAFKTQLSQLYRSTALVGIQHLTSQR